MVGRNQASFRPFNFKPADVAAVGCSPPEGKAERLSATADVRCMHCLKLAPSVSHTNLAADHKCASDSDCCQLFGDKQECGNAGKCVSSRLAFSLGDVLLAMSAWCSKLTRAACGGLPECVLLRRV